MNRVARAAWLWGAALALLALGGCRPSLSRAEVEAEGRAIVGTYLTLFSDEAESVVAQRLRLSATRVPFDGATVWQLLPGGTHLAPLLVMETSGGLTPLGVQTCHVAVPAFGEVPKGEEARLRWLQAVAVLLATGGDSGAGRSQESLTAIRRKAETRHEWLPSDSIFKFADSTQVYRVAVVAADDFDVIFSDLQIVGFAFRFDRKDRLQACFVGRHYRVRLPRW